MQTSFNKKKIDRFIDVDKLSKRSFQYNMEFVQFMKCYWDMHAPNGEGMPNQVFAEAQVPNEAPPAKQPKEEKAEETRAAPGKRPTASKPAPKPNTGASTSNAQQQQLALEVTELKMSVENLERERDFYYSKLREVEVLCQNNEGTNSPFLDSVLAILYKTDDADEFISPDEVESVPVS